MRIDILSLFPSYFQSPLEVSILKRAREKGLIEVHLHNIRDFAEDKHNRVDDRPYGGGPGMVMMPGPVIRAIRSVKEENSHVVFLTPSGESFTAKKSEEFAEKEHLILVCGHYEGIDERVMCEVDEKLSIGPFVLTNGCLAAMVVLDATSRFIPGVLGHEEAAANDSFQEEGNVEGPQYTRPEVFEEMRVPEVLLGGNHQEIKKWRKSQSLETTRQVRNIGERE